MKSEYVTVTVGGQLFGLPIARVQDVFVPSKLTRVPLAPDDIAGIINLRGRIVTAIDMRHRLGLDKTGQQEPLAVGVGCEGEVLRAHCRRCGGSLEARLRHRRTRTRQSRRPAEAGRVRHSSPR